MKLFITLQNGSYFQNRKASESSDFQDTLQNNSELVDELNVDFVLNPERPNLGGMEIFANIKQNLITHLN